MTVIEVKFAHNDTTATKKLRFQNGRKQSKTKRYERAFKTLDPINAFGQGFR